MIFYFLINGNNNKWEYKKPTKILSELGEVISVY